MRIVIIGAGGTGGYFGGLLARAGYASQPGKVSPTMVSITPTGFQVTAEVGWQGHQTDPLVDISITGVTHGRLELTTSSS
jgi:ketopantoate reductase